MELSNKVVLITGASSGMGRCVARTLSHRNNKIIITARRESLLNDLKKEIEQNGSQCVAIAADAIDEQSARKVVASGISTFGHIDAALLNAGGGAPLSTVECTAEQVKNYMQLNYDTVINYVFPLIQHMKERQQGIIAHTNSMASFFAVPLSGPYSAAKSAASILMDTFRIEYAKTPIRFINIYPGFVEVNGVKRKDVPVPFLVIPEERAAKEIITAIEKEKENYMFPLRMKLIINFARILPKSMLQKALSASVSA